MALPARPEIETSVAVRAAAAPSSSLAAGWPCPGLELLEPEIAASHEAKSAADGEPEIDHGWGPAASGPGRAYQPVQVPRSVTVTLPAVSVVTVPMHPYPQGDRRLRNVELRVTLGAADASPLDPASLGRLP